MWTGWRILRRVSSFSSRISVSELTRGYYRSLNNRLSMTLPENRVQRPFECPVKPSESSVGGRIILAFMATGGYLWTRYLTSTPAKCLMSNSREEEEEVNTENLRPLEVKESSFIDCAVVMFLRNSLILE